MLKTAPIVHVMVRRGGTALEQGRGLSPGGAISKWELPAMTSPLSVNHLCLISPPGALQSKYQCGRPTKTVGCIRRISQGRPCFTSSRRRFNYPSEANARRQLRTVQKSHRGEEEVGEPRFSRGSGPRKMWRNPMSQESRYTASRAEPLLRRGEPRQQLRRSDSHPVHMIYLR